MVRNTVSSEARAACCMLWVTMMMVYCCFSSSISSSIWSVDRGSSAEHGSSMSTISGSVAMARAMHSRCCCPPDSAMPDCLSLSLTSSQQRRATQARLDQIVQVALHAVDTRPVRDVVVDRLGERIGLLEHHADASPDLDRVDVRAVDVLAVVEHPTRRVRPGHQVVHAVDASQERGLAASRWPDERRDGVPLEFVRDVPDGAERAVEAGSRPRAG